jgi:hypothetical protein
MAVVVIVSRTGSGSSADRPDHSHAVAGDGASKAKGASGRTTAAGSSSSAAGASPGSAQMKTIVAIRPILSCDPVCPRSRRWIRRPGREQDTRRS